MTGYNWSLRTSSHRQINSQQTNMLSTNKHFRSQQTTIIPTTHLCCGVSPTTNHRHLLPTSFNHPHHHCTPHNDYSKDRDDASATLLMAMWQQIQMMDEDNNGDDG
jgi:hypothetical protein